MNHRLKEAVCGVIFAIGMQKSSISALTGASALAVLVVSLVSITPSQAFAHQRE